MSTIPVVTCSILSGLYRQLARQVCQQLPITGVDDHAKSPSYDSCMPYTYEFPRPSVSTDCLVFAVDGKELQVLLIKRGHDPFAGQWALPGGFLEMDEDLETCARRELMEETGIKTRRLEQLHTFGDVDRDPRGRVISIGFLALVNKSSHRPVASDDAADAAWFQVRRLPQLAFDHKDFIRRGLERLRSDARQKPIGIEAMPKTFALAELRSLYEAVLDSSIDATKFRRTILTTGHVVKSGIKSLFRFDRTVYRKLEKRGFGNGLFPV